MDRNSEGNRLMNDMPERVTSEHMRSSIAVKLEKNRPPRLLLKKRKRVKRDRHKRVKVAFFPLLLL